MISCNTRSALRVTFLEIHVSTIYSKIFFLIPHINKTSYDLLSRLKKQHITPHLNYKKDHDSSHTHFEKLFSSINHPMILKATGFLVERISSCTILKVLRAAETVLAWSQVTL